MDMEHLREQQQTLITIIDRMRAAGLDPGKYYDARSDTVTDLPALLSRIDSIVKAEEATRILHEHMKSGIFW